MKVKRPTTASSSLHMSSLFSCVPDQPAFSYKNIRSSACSPLVLTFSSPREQHGTNSVAVKACLLVVCSVNRTGPGVGEVERRCESYKKIDRENGEGPKARTN